MAAIACAADSGSVSPPPGAIALFGSRDLLSENAALAPEMRTRPLKPRWKVKHGYMEVVPQSGSIVTRQKFDDCRVHIERATPAKVKGNGQGRGNSGVFLPGQHEVQILDAFDNDTYSDGQPAAIYRRQPPSVNVCRKSGDWQSDDTTIERPRFDAAGNLVRHRRVTVVHNGVVVQDRVELGGGPAEGPILLQNHGNPVRFRNVWALSLQTP